MGRRVAGGAAIVVLAAICLQAAPDPDPGRPVTRRLTRAEYANAIRDLLDLEIDAASLLPADESLQGFDNIGGALSVSPSLLDRYLSAARRIARIAVGDPTIGPSFASKTYEAPQTLFQDRQMSEDLPFGSRGGMAIRHRFPLDGEYVGRIRLRRNILGYVRGLDTAHQLEVRLDGRRVAAFSVGGAKKGTPAPMGFTGVIAGDPAWEAYALTADAGLDVRFPATAGTHVVGVAFVDEPVEEEGVLQPRLTGLGFSYSEYRSAPTGPWGPAVDSVAIDGPYNPGGPGRTSTRQRLFTCQPATPTDAACARTIVTTVARRAYRRPVTEHDVEPLLAFFTKGATRAGFDAGIQSALERLLVDPNFLFRLERDPDGVTPGAAYRVGDVDLASRLSFFLWSSLPDDRLLDVAAAGHLHDQATLEAEVRRMLADDRASSLVDNFAAQWLTLRQLQTVSPDQEMFPEFDGNLREAFAEETRLFVASQIRADRSVLELLTANYTFVNDRLAAHYGMPGIYSGRYRRVDVSGARGGLLGQGSLLTVTSYPTRTSPVLRGRWLLDNILGTPPPPPPPNIPALPGREDRGTLLTMRQRTERHRSNPVCAGCHVRMDPLGFALENYDAIGRWRDVSETGAPIDASGAFPDGETFVGVAGLRTFFAGHREDFARTVTEKLLTYALGRTLEASDKPAVAAILAAAATQDYRWSAIVLAIVRSVPFQMKTAAS